MKLRILLAGVAAIVAMAFSASSALAVTAGPVGIHTATSGAFSFKVGTIQIYCESSKITTSADPRGGLHVTGSSYSGCQWPFFFGFTVSQSTLEAVTTEMAFDSNGLNTKLSHINLAFRSNICNFNVTGYESTTNLGQSPLTVSELVFPNTSASPATLKVASFPAGDSSHCAGNVALNDPVVLSATYKLSPPLVVTK